MNGDKRPTFAYFINFCGCALIVGIVGTVAGDLLMPNIMMKHPYMVQLGLAVIAIGLNEWLRNTKSA